MSVEAVITNVNFGELKSGTERGEAIRRFRRIQHTALSWELGIGL